MAEVFAPTGEQESDVLRYLKKATRKGLTPKEAWDMFSVYRLAAVIFRLRARGYDISTTIEKRPNKKGQLCNVSVYRLEV